jgi:putative membrane protein
MRLDSRFLTISALAAVLSLPVIGCQQSNENVQAARETTNTGEPRNKGLNDADKNFIIKAERDNIAERDLGRLVLEKSRNSDVRDYAQMLVNDHTKALKDLVDLMEQKGVHQPKGLPETKHEALGKLNGLSGAAFDREFIKLMIEDHQKEVMAFQDEVNMAQDGDVKYYAEHTLPVLQKHLKKAQELQAKMSGETTSN